MNDNRCTAQTDYQGDGPVSHKIRCDLDAFHDGQHQLRNRSNGALVVSWNEPVTVTGQEAAHARERVKELLSEVSTEDLVAELGARAGRSFLKALEVDARKGTRS